MIAVVQLGALRTIWSHVIQQPEREMCGVLLGSFGQATRVVDVVAAHNILGSPSEYLIDAATLLAADTRAQRTGHQIVGFYHSHPGHLALPSERDRRQAWPGYLYLIVSITANHAGTTCGWAIDQVGPFSPVLLQIAEGINATAAD